MLFEEGDCFQFRVDGGIFRSQIQSKSFLRFEGEARIVDGGLELTRSKVRRRWAGFPHHKASSASSHID